MSIIINAKFKGLDFQQDCFIRKSDDNRSVIITLIHQKNEEDAYKLINALIPLK